jgi:hypothetical protein
MDASMLGHIDLGYANCCERKGGLRDCDRSADKRENRPIVVRVRVHVQQGDVCRGPDGGDGSVDHVGTAPLTDVRNALHQLHGLWPEMVHIAGPGSAPVGLHTTLPLNRAATVDGDVRPGM